MTASHSTATVRVLTLAVVLCAAMSFQPRFAAAQVLRGTARVQGSARPIEGARIVAREASGREIGSTVTDDNGRFLLKVDAKGAPFVIAVSRIGMQPTTSDPITMPARDTLDADFEIDEVGIRTDTVRVSAAPSLNELRLKEAQRRGWRLFLPAEVAQVRERANSFNDLIRSLGYPGIIVPQREAECLRSTRYQRCLTIVLDGVPLSPGYSGINPRDVYFMAVLGASDAAVQFGDRAAYGALVVYTRMRGDK